MISLFIDTSFSDVSIAIVRDNNLLSYINENIPNKHSIYVTDYIKQTLDKCNLTANDINKIIVVNGPGSFTGVRIGVTIAKTYGYLLKKDIIPVSSLKQLALSINNERPILSLINAKNNNYYLGLYDEEYNELIEEQFTNISNVLNIINQYNPVIISNEDLTINDNINIKKVNLNPVKIVEYYQGKMAINPHELIPNYLKLPQPLEK